MKNILYPLFLLLFCLPVCTSAQGWEKTYGEEASEVFFDAFKTADDEIVFGGTQIGDSTNNAFMQRINENGELLWEFYDTINSKENGFLIEQIPTSDGNFLSISNFSDVYSDNYILMKRSTDGSLIWEAEIDSTIMTSTQYLAETPAGEYVVNGTFASIFERITAKYDNTGNLIWQNSYEYSTSQFSNLWPNSMIVASNGDVMLCHQLVYVDSTNSLHRNIGVARLDGNNGDVIWEEEYDNDNQMESPNAIIELPTGEFAISSDMFLEFPDGIKFTSLLKIDADGNKLMHKTYSRGTEKPISNETLIALPDNGYALAGTYKQSPVLPSDIYLLRVDSLGEELWFRTYGRSGTESIYDLMLAPDQGLFIAGVTEGAIGDKEPYLIKTDSQGFSISAHVNGVLYLDEDMDCEIESNEIGLKQLLVEATKGDMTYYSVTDSFGNYEFILDTGSYQINALTSMPYWDNCNSNFTINFSNPLDSFTQNIGAHPIVDCPLLGISIGIPFLRRCFENTYTVQYCNYGTLTAEDAFAEIILDPDMVFVSSSNPSVVQIGDTLTFDLDDIPLLECGSFTVNVLLGDSTDCESIPLGASHCIEAHIFPDSICTPSGNWLGASIEVDAICESDSIRFLIQNVGTAACQPNLEYIVIEDDVILFQGDFTLEPDEIETVMVLATGSTFTLQAEQEPNHPGISMPNVQVEGCGTANTMFTYGFINLFGQDDGNPFIDIDCRDNIGAFDPNDKKGFPLGYDDEHYIDRGQDIEYMIRFQNTGTDTAFRVIVLDTLSEFLDISSIRLGAASHQYSFNILDNRILSFRFDNIMLPDSNINEVASHGFLEFKISQKADLELETQIRNKAAIYFDFNEPIITNQTLHTIGENYIIILAVNSENKPLSFTNIYPNPFSDFTNIEIEGVQINNGKFQLFDATGSLIRVQRINSNTFTFSKKSLTAGMYFYNIASEGEIIANGKLMIQ